MGLSYLTNEEQAVVDAMRMGAKVQASFFFSTDEAYRAHAKKIDRNTFFKGDRSDLGNNLTAYHIESNTVTIVHFVQK